MKLKRIISTALTAVMIFTAVIAVFPMNVGAAYTETSASSNANVPEGVTEANLNSEQYDEYIDEYLSYNFSSASEMLGYELSMGYLYYSNSPGSQYTMYINKYTGFVYYVNNYTGQILTSNPYNPGYANVGEEDRELLMSQIKVSFVESANTEVPYEYNSVRWSARRGQISVSPIKGGMRVDYTLGDTTARFLLPGLITAEAFEENILIPMIISYQELLKELCAEAYPDTNLEFFDNEDYIQYEYGCINTSGTSKAKGFRYYLDETAKLYRALYKTTSSEFKRIDEFRVDLMNFIGTYALNAPAKYEGDERNQSKLEEMHNKYPITADGTAVYVCSALDTSSKNFAAKILKRRCPTYTFSMMFEHEKECDYVDNSAQKPVVRCSLEYTFNADGSLSVRLPANSITFDESTYTLRTITPLQFFGSGDMTKDGYIFYPDGSGTIVEFNDFYNEAANKRPSLSLSSSVYGNDYCYSKIVGAHREQIAMPVFGLVNDVNANPLTSSITGSDTATNGYFAIIEEGASLAKLEFISGGPKYKFASVYASYVPYPSDEYDLSETISVGSLGTYIITSKSKYTGSYVTRYVMLNDDDVGEKVYYESSYVGMAAYYRNYLKDTGVLTALEEVSENLPLYIEVLGAMDITDRFLSFPITKSIPLTTFDNISTIYAELSNCEEFVVSKIAEYQKLLETEKDAAQIYHYEQLIERYEELVGNIKNINNVNFKLTGFANGGMNSTYPVKLKWARACGGKSGFKALVKEANAVSETASNFGIFPEFDFTYINNTSMFDGISNKGNVAKMVDNRYASKQVYDSVSQTYESFFTMVINTEALEKLYAKFTKKYSKYNTNGISVSTLGSDLNSNFDEKAPVNRDESMNYVTSVLDQIANDDGYDVMIDKGNVYAIEYATHILNLSIDSSHFRYSSYTVPFIGLVLHSYVNYSGSPLNYSGSAEYEILRSIESGASLYYILCYQNSAYLKDDENLSKYFGVDYNNWYDSIVKTYTELNNTIGDLQKHEIVDHTILIAERIIDENESEANYLRLKAEALELLDSQILEAVNNAYTLLASDPANASKRLKVDITDENRVSLMNQFKDALNISVAELEASDFGAEVDKIIAKYEAEYVGASDEVNTYTINFDSIVYTTKYTYITDSCATDKNYVYTNYTNDNGNVTMVTYKSGESVVKFVLNYNNYPVSVRLNAAEEPVVLEAYGYVRIEEVN